MITSKAHIVSELSRDILRLQGFKAANNTTLDAGLGVLGNAFPNASFPLGCVHEFLTARQEDIASTTGFITGILTSLMKKGGVSLWISASRKLFPPALMNFGIAPERIIFIDVQKEKDVLWVMEEALKCAALTAVVGELHEISFTTSRRLQLAVEQSQVTGFVVRQGMRKVSTTACVSRWKITPLPSVTVDDLPGVGFPQWRVELLKIRNGKPGSWDVKWVDGQLEPAYKLPYRLQEEQRKAG